MSILAPFQLLELNLISAQDLAPASRAMRTYAIAWVHPDRKLSTRVDTHGHNNPTWNDKFVFRVDDEFLHNDTSAVMIEIYALHWFRDIHVGTVRILVGNLIPTPPRLHPYNKQPQVGMRFVALQVRRQSGRPQGILNIGVALLHSSMRSMPLYSQLSTSAVGYRQLMGEDSPHHNHHHNINNPHPHLMNNTKPELRRIKSDTSSMIVGSELRGSELLGFNGRVGTKSKASSMVSGAEVAKKKKKKKKGVSRASSLISVSRSTIKGKKEKKGKSRSVISGSELEDLQNKEKRWKPRSIVNGIEATETPKNGKNEDSSSINDSDIAPVYEPPPKQKTVKVKPEFINSPRRKEGNDKSQPFAKINPIEYVAPQKTPTRATPKGTPLHDKYATPQRGVTPLYDKYATPQRGVTPLHGKTTKFQDLNYGTPRKSFLSKPFLTESELGPSPSEVAAAMAQAPKVDDGGESSVVGGWSLDGSVEGLQSKLERWRTELPPVHDRGEYSSFQSSESRHTRRHTDGGTGLFSCFSNICGCQCSIVCGGKKPKKTASGRVHRSPSAENLSYS